MLAASANPLHICAAYSGFESRRKDAEVMIRLPVLIDPIACLSCPFAVVSC